MNPEGGTLPLFPLRTVLFPGGRLALKVFEARYLDLVSACLRARAPFGVVCLQQGSEVRQPGTEAPAVFEPVGVLAHLADVDAPSAGLLKLRCDGGLRFRWEAVRQADDGLWLAEGTRWIPADPAVPPEPAHEGAVQALQRAFAALALRGEAELPPAQHFDEAGWVANRWCELLPVPLAARQQLMALEDPVQRLSIVDQYLRGKQLI